MENVAFSSRMSGVSKWDAWDNEKRRCWRQCKEEQKRGNETRKQGEYLVFPYLNFLVGPTTREQSLVALRGPTSSPAISTVVVHQRWEVTLHGNSNNLIRLCEIFCSFTRYRRKRLSKKFTWPQEKYFLSDLLHKHLKQICLYATAEIFWNN